MCRDLITPEGGLADGGWCLYYIISRCFLAVFIIMVWVAGSLSMMVWDSTVAALDTRAANASMLSAAWAFTCALVTI